MPKFSRTQKFTKENIAKVPQDKAIVYKIKDSEGENLYTGIAGRGRSQERLLEHKEVKKEKIPEGTRFQFVQVKNKDRARIVEEQIIKKDKPEFNEQHK
jgi:excinuclease UvrABC nuclease subunit